MVYNDFKGLKLSGLGLGCMRLPQNSDDLSDINEIATAEMIDYAMKNGINYYDTAYGYHNGQSELVVGKILEQYPRESFFLTSKFPGYDLANMDKVAAIFEEQLQKCRTEYFDFYLFHNVCELNINEYLDPKYGIADYLVEQKKAGRIKHLGFSVHGSLATTKRFLEAYGDIVEFCQMQLNYIDWTFQDAKSVVEMLHEYKLPIWVMEPLRGGSLAKMSAAEFARLQALRSDETVPSWAFRFVQSIEGVGMVLSGMSSLQQVKENIATWTMKKPLNQIEFDTLQEIAKEKIERTTLPCTRCSYCVSHCPQGLNIPDLLEIYNEHYFTVQHSGNLLMAPRLISLLPDEKKPSACIACHSCEAVCPQQIKIAAAMADLTNMISEK